MTPDYVQQEEQEHTRNWILSGIAGITASAVATAATIRAQFWEDIKDVPEVKALLTTQGEELHKHWASAKDKSRNIFHSELDAIKKRHDGEMAQLLHDHHYASVGWENIVQGIIDRASSMDESSQRSIAINAAITAAVAIGGTYMFLNNHHMRDKLDRLGKQSDHISSRVDRLKESVTDAANDNHSRANDNEPPRHHERDVAHGSHRERVERHAGHSTSNALE